MRILALIVTIVVLWPGALGAQDSLDQSLRKREIEQRDRLDNEKKLNQTLYDALRHGLLNDDVQVRLKSIRGIMEIEGIPEKESVIKDYLDDRHPLMRIEILDYYGRLARPRDTTTLLLMLEDEDFAVREKLVDVLLTFQATGVEVYDLIKLMLEDKQLHIRRRMLEGISALDDQDVDPKKMFAAVRDNLFDGVQGLRSLALEIIGDYPIELIQDSIESALLDPQVEFRMQALEIAAKNVSDMSTRLLTPKLNDSLPEIRSRVIEVLSERMDPDLARIFDSLLKDEVSPDLRIKMLEGVATLRSRQAVGILTNSLDDNVLRVRRRAASLLKEMQETVNIDPRRTR